MIYIAHPFNGDSNNRRKVERIIRKLVKENPMQTYVSPIHTFGFLYEDIPCEQVLAYCAELLGKCERIYVYGDWHTSKSCKAEIEFAKANNIPIEIKP